MNNFVVIPKEAVESGIKNTHVFDCGESFVVVFGTFYDLDGLSMLSGKVSDEKLSEIAKKVSPMLWEYVEGKLWQKTFEFRRKTYTITEDNGVVVGNCGNTSFEVPIWKVMVHISCGEYWDEIAKKYAV